MENLIVGAAPIPGDHPAGTDIRSSSLFEQITEEIDKRTALTSTGTTDWNKVIAVAQNILSEHSKDILVCSYLNVGLLNISGLRGLADGVQIYRDLVITYWNNGLFPPRINGRLNAISWWADNISEQLHKMPTEKWLATDKLQLEKNYTELIDFLSENGVEDLDQIYMLRHANMSLILEATNEEELTSSNSETTTIPIAERSSFANGNQEATVTSQQQATSILRSVSSDIVLNIDDNLERSLDSVLMALNKVSALIANEQPLSYKLYKINRFIAWFDVDIIPPADTELKTMLPPPDEHLQQLIIGYYQEQNWLELLKVAETRVVDFRFWFDLSYYVHRSLIGINQQHAANEVSYAVLLLIKRLKGVEKLCFSDGMPFATNETQEWINSILGDVGGGVNSYSTALQGNEELALELHEASELAKSGKELAAIAFLHQKIITSSSIQARFIRILQFCQYSLSTGNGQLASGYVNEILSIIDAHQLESWDPVMAANAYKLILNMSKQKKAIKLSEAAINDVLSRLTILDPTIALGYY
ncbi:type VI secretion system protein TssA [Aquella oligotrophica]|uniref:Type VI secretion system protein TssA n=1 Tax=Aquella oligotrophica TaxID=2067065 RepID=A0A2I7N3E1_9NEIS|nr:type VI secretion system protein TssA [Aquella oligotrophica]AUR50962.1 type VI secretion system protein TssA [Aquella oligotrophica]